MPIYSLGQLTLAQLREIADVQDRGVVPELWEARSLEELSADERAAVALLRRHLLPIRTHALNEATLWARAIYPVLTMAERDDLRALSAVALSAALRRGELRGEVDGVLARLDVDASALPPFVVVVEAKRGAEGSEPVAQLLGGLLCAAWRNHQVKPRPEHLLYGIITIADVWTFVRATISSVDGDRPLIGTVFSREYLEKTEAEEILRLLKSMVAELLAA